jgi:hypothetical protein
MLDPNNDSNILIPRDRNSCLTESPVAFAIYTEGEQATDSIFINIGERISIDVVSSRHDLRYR